MKTPTAPDGLAVPTSIGSLDARLVTQIEKIFLVLIGAFAVSMVYGILSDRAIYSDGAWFFLRVALDGEVFNGNRPARLVAVTVTQFPLLTALKLGVTDFEVLKPIYTAGQYSPYLMCIAVWWWATQGQRQYLLVLMAYLFLSAMNSLFFLASESHYAGAVFMAQLPLLMLVRELRMGHRLVLAVLALGSIASYETMLLYGVVLLGLAVLRWFQDSSGRGFWLGLAAWYVVVVGFAVSEILAPAVPGMTSGHFFDHFVTLITLAVFGFLQGYLGLHYGVVLSIFAGLILVATYFFGTRFPRLAELAVLGFALVTSLIVALLIYAPAMLEVSMHYQARVLQAGLPVGLAFLMLCWKHGWIKATSRWFRQAALVLGILGSYHMVWQFMATYQWNGYIEVYQEVVEAGDGAIPLETSRLGQRREGRQAIENLNWGWTHPIMSMVVGADPINGIVAPEGQVKPFDASDPSTFPDLSRFGISWDTYPPSNQPTASATLR